jgi:hypothetical protein
MFWDILMGDLRLRGRLRTTGQRFRSNSCHCGIEISNRISAGSVMKHIGL